MTSAPDAIDRLTGNDEQRLVRIVTWVASCIAIFVTLAAPIGYFTLSRQAQAMESAVAARLHAAFVTLAIGGTQGEWRAQAAGLINADLAPSIVPETRELRDERMNLLDRAGPDMEHAWVVSGKAPVQSSEGTVGEVIVKRSLRPILIESLVVTLFSALLGFAIYASLRILPLRALRRSMDALKRTEAKGRVEAEENLRIVFEHALDSIIMFSPTGNILSCNPSTIDMLGYSESTLQKMKLDELLARTRETSQQREFAPAQFETLARRSAGDELAVEVTISDSHAMGKSQRIAIIRDITERQLAQARLAHMANYDNLTGLPNRSLFRERLQLAMERCQRSGEKSALMFLDLDRFKTINDSLGHEFGDKLLKLVAKALTSCLRQSDFLGRFSDADEDVGVYRLGGDEFTVLIEGLPDEAMVAQIAKRILATMSQPFEVGVHQLFISVSIGITLYPQDNADLDILVKQADLAMYRSKSLGRNTYAFFSEELDEAVSEQHALETRLRHALERHEFKIVYQPKADMVTGRITGVEALLRWAPADGTAAGPDKFIPILEDTGLIVPVGMWVLREACQQLKLWQDQGIIGLNMAVNLSARQFRQEDLVMQIAAVILETGLQAGSLEIELTESSLVDDSEAVVKIMESLGQMDLRVAVDDFGTGHSSLRYLKRFDVDTLKIDRSFVQDIPDDPEDNAIAIAVIALGHGLGLKVVAEGVETQAQAAFLRAHGCDEIQGYLLSRPLAPGQFVNWYKSYEETRNPAGRISVAPRKEALLMTVEDQLAAGDIPQT